MLTTKAMPRMASRGRLQRPALMLLAVAAGVLWAGALLQPTTAKALSTQIWCPSSYANFICEESSFAYRFVSKRTCFHSGCGRACYVPVCGGENGRWQLEKLERLLVASE